MLSESQKTALKLLGYSTRPDAMYPEIEWIIKNGRAIAMETRKGDWVFNILATKEDQKFIRKLLGRPKKPIFKYSHLTSIKLKLLGFTLRGGMAEEHEFVIEYEGQIAAIKKYSENFWHLYDIDNNHLISSLAQILGSNHVIYDE